MPVSVPFGVDFRATVPFVSDPANCVAEVTTVVDYSAGQGYGWESFSSTGQITRDRSTTNDHRLAGMHGQSNGVTADFGDFRVDLANGNYLLALAIGDNASNQTNQTVELFDGATSLGVVVNNGDTVAVDRFFDATGVLRTSSADWVTNNAVLAITITSGILRIRCGPNGRAANTGGFTCFAHLKLTAVAAPTGTPTRAFQEPDAFQPTGFQKPDPTDAFITRLHAFFQESGFQRPDPTGVFQFQAFDDEGFQPDFEAFTDRLFQGNAFQIDELQSIAYVVSGVGAISSAETFGGADRVIRWLGPGGVGSGQQFGVTRVVRWLGPGGVASGEAFGQSAALRRILAAVGVATGESFGTTKVIRWVGPGGIASAQAFGLPRLLSPQWVTGVGAIASLEQLGGADKVIRLLGPAGIATGQAFGTTQLIRWIGPGGVASANTFGTTKLLRLIFPLGIASAEAFGRPTTIGGIQGISVSGVGAIGSLEAFGVAAVRRILAEIGIGSAEAFGLTKNVRWVGPGGVPTGFGSGTPALRRLLGPAGIISAELVSQPRLLRRLAVVNITTGEAFGIATLTPLNLGAPGVPGSIALADLSPIGVMIGDRDNGTAGLAEFQPVDVLVADGETWLILASDQAIVDIAVSDRPGG